MLQGSDIARTDDRAAPERQAVSRAAATQGPAALRCAPRRARTKQRMRTNTRRSSLIVSLACNLRTAGTGDEKKKSEWRVIRDGARLMHARPQVADAPVLYCRKIRQDTNRTPPAGSGWLAHADALNRPRVFSRRSRSPSLTAASQQRALSPPARPRAVLWSEWPLVTRVSP